MKQASSETYHKARFENRFGWMKWFVMYMALAGGNYMVYSMVLPVRIFHHIIVSAILIFWFMNYGLPRTPLLFSFLGMAASVLLSALASDDKRMALEFAWHWLTNGALLIMAVEWFRMGYQNRLFNAQFAAGGIVAGTCLLEWLLYGGRPGGAFFNINLVGGYLAAMVVPVYAHSKYGKTGLYRVALWLLLGAIGVVLLLNHSRGAMLSAAVAVLAYTLMRHTTPKALIAAVGLTGVIAVALAYMSTVAGHMAGDVVRMDLWRVALELIEGRALGVGPGLFGQAYQLLGASGEWRFTGAHSLYLNLGAELGGVGLASGAASALTFLYIIAFKRRTPHQDASIAALFGVAAHMMVDNFPSQGFSFLVSLYVAHAAYQKWPVMPFWPRQFSWGASAAVLIGALYLLNFDRAQIAYERSLATGSFSSAQEAVLIDPYNRLYLIQYSRVGRDGDMSAAVTIAPGLANSTDNLMTYGLINYGRVFQ